MYQGAGMDRRRYNPSRVKDMMEKTESANKGRHKATSQELEENSGWEMLSLEETLTYLEGMSQPPLVEDLVCILNKCKKEKKLPFALRLHAYLHTRGLEGHRSLGNILLSMLVEVGCMHNAQQVFDRLVYRNEYSWCFLITGHVRCEEPHHALTLYQKMQKDSVHPSGPIFVALLKACAQLKDAKRGRELHAQISRKGLEGDLFIGSTLVDMYAKCSLLAKAQEVFDKLLVRDVVSWNALIAGFAKHGRGVEALNCFEQMKLEGISPNTVTFILSLKACGSIGATEKGREIHAEIARRDLLERDVSVGSTLVDMYANCGLVAKAQEVFDKLPVQDAVTWNALIAGYTRLGNGEEALNCFEQMQLQGISPDSVTFVCILKACCSIGAADKGQEMHVEIARKGLEQDLVLGNALVNMYVNCGLLAKAQEVLDNLSIRNAVSWTGLIAGYAKHGHGQKALSCLEQMQLEGVSPDAFTFVCSLKACGSIGAAAKGEEIHAEVASNGMLERGPFVGSALVDMYVNCGLLAKAQDVFNKLPVRDVVSWTALIAGYAQLGESENVFHMLDRMRREGIKPNWVTFLSVLSACSHAGQLDLGQAYFEAMSKDYGITPTLEHFTCMIDLLGRAGQFDKVVAMIKEMPFHPNLVMWHTVLGACRKWGNVDLGRQAFEHAVRLDEKDAGAYFCMFNIYVYAGMQEDARKVDAMRLEKQAWTKPGHCWWMDFDEMEHSFSVGDKDIFKARNISQAWTPSLGRCFPEAFYASV